MTDEVALRYKFCRRFPNNFYGGTKNPYSWILYRLSMPAVHWVLTTPASIYSSKPLRDLTKEAREQIQAGNPHHQAVHAFVTKCRLLGVDIQGWP